MKPSKPNLNSTNSLSFASVQSVSCRCNFRSPPNLNSLRPTTTAPSSSERRPVIWTACAPPGTPQRRSRRIREFMSSERQNRLLFRDTQMAELRRAQRNRKKGNWKFAAAILNALREYADRTNSFLNETIYVRSAELAEDCPDITPRELLDDLMSHINESRAISSVKTFNAVLCALQKRLYGKFHNVEDTLDTSLRVFDIMQRKGIVPDDYTYAVVFDMCGTALNKVYLRVFEQRARDIWFENNNDSNIDNDDDDGLFGLREVACSSLVCTRSKLGDIDGAEALVSNMRVHGLSATERAYICFIGALQRAHMHNRVIEQWGHAYAEKIVTKPHVFYTVIVSCYRTGDSKNAQRAVLQFLENGSVPIGAKCLETVFSCALGAYDIDVGERVLFEWGFHDEEFMTTTTHIARLVTAIGRKYKSVENEKMVQRIWDIIDRMHFVLCIDEDVVVLNAVADALMKLGHPEEARQVIFATMPKRNIVPNIESFKILLCEYPCR